MCLFTHFAAGALAGGATGNVWIGAVAGLASHAVLDAIPHYDHPDWRLELSGGLASLILLLLLPFGGAAAVVGGIAGMVPDLENLFQKLGWMGRNRFVFPSHTGLVPHGRTLGPRSLVWQVAIFVACFGALGLLAPGTAAAATAETVTLQRPQVTVLAADENRTVVRLEVAVDREPADWRALPASQLNWRSGAEVVAGQRATEPPRHGISFALPSRRKPQVSVRDVQWWREPTRAVAPHELVSCSVPGLQRGVPLTGAGVSLGLAGGILRSLTVEFSHPADVYGRQLLDAAAGKAAAGPSLELPLAPVVNPGLCELLTRAAGRLRPAAAAKADPADLFGLTTNWLRLYVDETALHRVTGSELVDLGVPVSAVDPDKLRLYRGGGLHLAADPETPDADQSRRVGLNEVAIEVLDGSDGEWNLTDEFRFYGVATSVWRDRLAPGARNLAAGEMRLEHYDHPAASQAVYWLTWASDAAPASPLPGVPRRVIPQTVPAGAGPPRSSAQVRLHLENQADQETGLVEDNWVWEDEINGSRFENFTVHRPLPGAPARFVVDVRGVRAGTYDTAAQLNLDTSARATMRFATWNTIDSLRCRIIGQSAALQPGNNTLTVYDETAFSSAELALDAFDIMYEDELVLETGWTTLAFGLWGDEVTVPATGTDLQLASDQGVVLWDVTVPDSALVLTGTVAGNTTTYGLLREPGEDRHFVAVRPNDLATVARTSLRAPRVLKDEDPAVDYLVVSHEAFLDAATILADYRATDLPGIASPRARAVDVQDIYDGFSGGQKDALAIRNYLRWVYLQGGGRLKYACFLGNASNDPRKYGGGQDLVDLTDLVPTFLRSGFPRSANQPSPAYSHFDFYATDDGLVSFDTAPEPDYPWYPGLDFPDLACGRLAALNASEARGMVERAIAYCREPEPGLWRNRLLLLADDAWHSENYPYEKDHTDQADHIAETYIPVALDVDKLFAADFPFPPGGAGKPEVNRRAISALDAGTTVYYYVGHGSQDNLGDEQYFRSGDIANLTNGMRRPVFMAFSCDVGVYDSTIRRSMAEQFVAAPNGGAAAAICASQVSWINSNEHLTDAFFQALFPGREVDPAVTLGAALQAAKGAMAEDVRRSNSQRYLIFGDPALRLPHPVHELTFVPDTGDTLRPGLRQEVAVAASGPGALLGPGDSWDLLVEESSYTAHYITTSSDGSTVFENPWTKRGGIAYRGTGTVESGDLRIPFKSPAQSRSGVQGRIRLLVEDGQQTRAAAMIVPVVRSSLGEVDDLVGPQITLGFEDGRDRVTPGTVLAATLRDSSSIAVLGTAPGNSISLEYDDSGFLVDVTDAFVFDANSHQSGRLAVAVPGDLELGSHVVELIAADALGNTSTDSVGFELVAAGVDGIHDMTLFPNPTAGPCRLIFELSDAMEVRWDIYTVAGRRVTTVLPSDGRLQGPGPTILEWNGLDGEGDELANGTYIYVLRGVAGGRDGRDLNRTGKLVIMR